MFHLLPAHRAAWRGAGVGLALGAMAACAPLPSSSNSGQRLATAAVASIGLQLTATGFFVDQNGHVLTAGHAATNCVSLFVNKGKTTLSAKLVAQSLVDDLAVLKVDETLSPPAVFARNVTSAAHDMVFAAAYQTLDGILARGGALSNAVVAGDHGRDPHADIELVSDATHGASGAPVLSSTGLVIGVITHKLQPDRVLATNADDAKRFLAANHIPLEEDDRPQLGAFQDHARRAATISVGVTCFK
jgi:serine protease Do